jgi:CPA2 family monovalent cation:H+ antiporter-2
VQDKIMPVELSQLLMTIVIITMALTPLLASIGRRIERRIYIKDTLIDSKLKKEIGDISGHIIIIGFGRVGRVVNHFFKKRDINHIILSDDNSIVTLEKANGGNIYYGDALNIDILNHINIKKAESVIVTMEDEFACIKVIRFIRNHFPEILIITKSDTINNATRFKKFGADEVVIKNLETGLQIGRIAIKNSIGDVDGVDDTFEEFYDVDSDFIKNILKLNDKKF